MSSQGLLRPFVVSAFFYDQASGQAAHFTFVEKSVSADAATGQAISRYYVQLGGKLPLIASGSLVVTRDMAVEAVALWDTIEAADQTEADKVVTLAVVPPQEPAPPAA